MNDASDHEAPMQMLTTENIEYGRGCNPLYTKNNKVFFFCFVLFCFCFLFFVFFIFYPKFSFSRFTIHSKNFCHRRDEKRMFLKNLWSKTDFAIFSGFDIYDVIVPSHDSFCVYFGWYG